MIKFPCPQCSMTISAADEHVGRKGKCPSCQHVMVIPGSAAQPVPAKTNPQRQSENVKPSRPAPAPVRRKPRAEADDPPYVAEAVDDDDEVEEIQEVRRSRSRRDAEDDYNRPRARARRPVVEDDDEDDDRPRRRPRRNDNEDDDRPRRRKRRPRTRWRGEFARCPNCRAPGDATRLYYTIWGGFIGPLLINHVRCNQCGTGYNGTTGDYNTGKIALFLGVSWGIALILIMMRLLFVFLGP